MAVLCGWASIDERGKASGGKAGDQTSKEVRTGNWYDFGQTVVLRWKDRAKASKYASIVKAICNNNKVGYNQTKRTTLETQLEKCGWDPAKIKTACDCDCSAMSVAAVNCVAKKRLVSPSLYTGNMVDGLMKTGWFTKLTGAKYCDQSAYLMTGDIIVRPNHHVIMALANGSKVSSGSASKPASKPAASKPASKPAATPAKKKALKVGAKIKLKKGAKQYGKSVGFNKNVYSTVYVVRQISGKRLVFATPKGVVMGAIKSSDCNVV